MEFFKLLPKTNCKDCGQATCLAFAMQLANGKAKIDQCPHVSAESKSALSDAAGEPVKTVVIGNVKMGGETVLYRHERRFVNPIAFAVSVSDKEVVSKKVEEIKKIKFDRVGTVFDIDMISVKYDSGNPDAFCNAVKNVSQIWKNAMCLECNDASVIEKTISSVGVKPLIYYADEKNISEMCAVAKKHKCALAIKADGPEAVSVLSEKAKSLGVEDLVLDFNSKNTKECIENNTIARRSALKKKFKPLGYPIMSRVGSGEYAVMTAVISTLKYGSLVIFDELKNYEALPLFTLRHNIYTDPQVPIQVKQDLYPINNPDEHSPIMFTTNFSLTYFTVRADIEKSRLPVWLQIINTEGLSVLTAYAAGKFDPERVVSAFEESKVLDKSDGVVIVPGLTARMTEKLESLIKRKTIVGTCKSKDIPKHLSSLKNQ